MRRVVRPAGNPLHAQKRPRRKASPKPDKAPANGLSPRQRAIFSIGAHLIRAIYPQRLQGTAFAQWCAQEFDTNEHAYSINALAETSDRYAATYGMPRVGRSTIAARNQELEHVSVHRREDVGISPKDGRLRRITPSNRYVLHIDQMIKTLHEADPEHVMPVWDKIVRSMEEDHDHLIWTPNWTSNWTPNWCYSSTSSNSPSGCPSPSGASSPGDDDAREAKSGGVASSPVKDDLLAGNYSAHGDASSDEYQVLAVKVEETLGSCDYKARYLAPRFRSVGQSMSVSAHLLEQVIGWWAFDYAALDGANGKDFRVPSGTAIKGKYLWAVLPDLVQAYLAARSAKAAELGLDACEFDLAEWLTDEADAVAAAEAAE